MPQLLHFPARIILTVIWVGLALAMILRKSARSARPERQDRLSLLGLFVQFVAYSIVFVKRRPQDMALIKLPDPMNLLLALTAIVIAICSAWFLVQSVRVLGKQFNLTAQVVEGHHLITRGPYRWVRHPIYTSMLGLLLSSGLVFSYLFSTILSVGVYLIGTSIRVKCEDRLLRQAFGKEFEDYTGRVAAIIPRIW